MYRRARAEIDAEALRHNHARACALGGTRAAWPVIKGDAYGHGMLDAARVLDGAAGFIVADVQEGIVLRSAGFAHRILVLQGAWNPSSLKAAVAADLELGCHDPSQLDLADAYSAVLREHGTHLWLEVETGMHRLGLDRGGAEALERLQAIVGPDRVVLMTHFARADTPEHAQNAEQIRRFNKLRSGVDCVVSACNSAALVSGLVRDDDIVRPGVMLYGVSPVVAQTAIEVDLRPVLTLRSELMAVKTVAAGEPVGYGGTWAPTRGGRIGVVAAGYGDGYPRNAPNGTPVLVAGKRVPLIGRVSMDSLSVDLHNHPQAQVGDDVVLWGQGLPVEEIATAAGTIGYELLTRIPPRVPRIGWPAPVEASGGAA